MTELNRGGNFMCAWLYEDVQTALEDNGIPAWSFSYNDICELCQQIERDKKSLQDILRIENEK